MLSMCPPFWWQLTVKLYEFCNNADMKLAVNTRLKWKSFVYFSNTDMPEKLLDADSQPSARIHVVLPAFIGEFSIFGWLYFSSAHGYGKFSMMLWMNPRCSVISWLVYYQNMCLILEYWNMFIFCNEYGNNLTYCSLVYWNHLKPRITCVLVMALYLSRQFVL